MFWLPLQTGPACLLLRMETHWPKSPAILARWCRQSPSPPPQNPWAVSASDSNHLFNSLPDPWLWFSMWRLGLICQVSVYRDGLFDSCAVNEMGDEGPPLGHESLSCHPNWGGGRPTSWNNNNDKQKAQRYLAMGYLTFLSLPPSTPQLRGAELGVEIERPWDTIKRTTPCSVPSCLHMGFIIVPVWNTSPAPIRSGSEHLVSWPVALLRKWSLAGRSRSAEKDLWRF